MDFRCRKRLENVRKIYKGVWVINKTWGGLSFRKSGNVPTTEYYDKIYPKKLGGWRSPTIMSVGIGQGELQLTTLQMANLAACIANQGYWYVPHLAKEFKDKTPIPARFREKHTVSIDKRHFQLVTEGMAECVNRGTARSCSGS